jgi:stress response protein YsnF
VPVVEKTARVVEEVVIRKEATERTETIKDTVRHEEVDVTRVNGPGVEKR